MQNCSRQVKIWDEYKQKYRVIPDWLSTRHKFDINIWFNIQHEQDKICYKAWYGIKSYKVTWHGMWYDMTGHMTRKVCDTHDSRHNLLYNMKLNYVTLNMTHYIFPS